MSLHCAFQISSALHPMLSIRHSLQVGMLKEGGQNQKTEKNSLHNHKMSNLVIPERRMPWHHISSENKDNEEGYHE